MPRAEVGVVLSIRAATRVLDPPMHIRVPLPCYILSLGMAALRPGIGS